MWQTFWRGKQPSPPLSLLSRFHKTALSTHFDVTSACDHEEWWLASRLFVVFDTVHRARAWCIRRSAIIRCLGSSPVQSKGIAYSGSFQWMLRLVRARFEIVLLSALFCWFYGLFKFVEMVCAHLCELLIIDFLSSFAYTRVIFSWTLTILDDPSLL